MNKEMLEKIHGFIDNNINLSVCETDLLALKDVNWEEIFEFFYVLHYKKYGWVNRKQLEWYCNQISDKYDRINLSVYECNRETIYITISKWSEIAGTNPGSLKINGMEHQTTEKNIYYQPLTFKRSVKDWVREIELEKLIDGKN